MPLWFAMLALLPGQASKAAALPVSGVPVPALKALDDAMLKAMGDRGWRAGVLAASRGGRTVFSRGYGFRDAAGKKPTQPDTPFRIASIGKPITAAAIRVVVAEGRLKLSDPAFGVLGLAPGPGGDPRLKDVTIEHLLKHRGGWNRDTASIRDPMFQSLDIARRLGRPAPASPRDVIDFMLTQPLEAAPGEKSSYSNFGYCVLGRILEKRSGLTLIEELRRRVATPLGMRSLALARSLPADRHPAEPAYLDPGPRAVNVFDPEGRHVPWPDGGFHLEAMDAHGGLICSAPDLLKFARAFHVDGVRRTPGDTSRGRHFGSLPGAFGMLQWRGDGIEWAALFNQREAGSIESKVGDELDAAIGAIKDWP